MPLFNTILSKIAIKPTIVLSSITTMSILPNLTNLTISNNLTYEKHINLENNIKYNYII